MIISWAPTILLILHSIFLCSTPTNTIFTESGINRANTYHFTAESPWKLSWTAQGTGSITVLARELDSDFGLYIAGEHLSNASSGSTWVYDISGPMYLQIGGSQSGNEWTVEVSR